MSAVPTLSPSVASALLPPPFYWGMLRESRVREVWRIWKEKKKWDPHLFHCLMGVFQILILLALQGRREIRFAQSSAHDGIGNLRSHAQNECKWNSFGEEYNGHSCILHGCILRHRQGDIKSLRPGSVKMCSWRPACNNMLPGTAFREIVWEKDFVSELVSQLSHLFPVQFAFKLHSS